MPFSVTRADVAIETAKHRLRRSLLEQQAVARHLLQLHTLEGDSPRFWDALMHSPLLAVFDLTELQHRVAVAPERVRLGVLAASVPVDPDGAGYGRRKARARAMSEPVLDLVVVDIVARLEPEAERPDTLELANGATIRSYRRRLRELRYR